MGNIGEPMTNQTVPTVGSSGTNYARDISLFLEEVKQRLEDSVPLSSVTLTSLDMTNNPIQNAQYLGIYEGVISPTTPQGSIHYYDGNFYMVTDVGVVKVTDGALMEAAAAGNITGDFGGANPAQWRFVDADETFYAYDDYAGGAFARVFARSFDVSGDGTGSERVRITWAGSASYSLTLPAAVPAGQLILQMAADGSVSTSNTLASAVTITTGDLTLGAGDINLAVDQDIILSGTGRIKHGTRTVHDLAALRCAPGAGGVTISNGPQAKITVTLGQQVNIHCPPVEVGMQINTIHITGLGTGASTAPTITVDTLGSDNTLVNRPVTSGITGVVTGAWEYTLTLTTPWVVATGSTPVVRYTPAGANAEIYSIQVKFTSV